MTDPRAVVLDEASRLYDGGRGLQKCSLSIAAGQVLGVAGPNGAGKSTLSRLSLGLLRPDTGTATILGQSASEYRRTAGVGYLPEDLDARWWITPRELLAVRHPRGRLGRLKIVDLLGIGELLDRPLATLSKGQFRISLTAYACLGPSRFVVLDEPDAGLDPGAVDRVARTITACAEDGAAVMVLSHQLELLETVAHDLIILADGNIRGSVAGSELRAAGARSAYRRLVS